MTVEEFQDQFADLINEAIDPGIESTVIAGTLAMMLSAFCAGTMMQAMGEGETRQ